MSCARSLLLLVIATALLAGFAAAAQEVSPGIEPPVDSRGRMLMEIIHTLERDLEELGRTRRQLNRQKETLERDLAILQERISVVDRELNKGRKQIEKLLRGVVLMKEPDDLLLFFSTMRYHDLHVYRRTIRKITTTLSQRLSRLVEVRKKLDRRRASLQHEADRLNARRQSLLKEIEEVEKVARRTKTELKDRARKIAAIESLFMNADFDSPYVEPGAHDSLSVPEGQPAKNLADYRRKKELIIPVSPGKIVKGFEEMPSPPLGTEKMVRGWILVPYVKGKKEEATQTAFVRTPFEGIVVFVGEVPGFGLTVVLDHGHGFHTVYANLYKIHVVKADLLARDQVLGTIRSIRPGTDELPYLYFELRQNRIAIEPKPWFRLRPLDPGERH